EWLIGDVEAQEIILTSEGKGELFESLSIIPSSRHLANMSKLLILSEGEVRKLAGRKERLLKIRLDELREHFDYVVIDTPPMLGDELVMALVAANRVFIPTQAQDYSIDGLEELMDTFEIIKETENPDLEFSIIPSMINIRRNVERQRLEELQQSFSVTPPVKNLVQYQESISLQRPVCLMGKKSRGRQALEALWDSLGF
ncbi:MAG: ParA family protein, partial [Bacteriovoracales bacterium]|nr:ParA family protein [Bacteriovoracales bacterium]